MKKFSIAFVFLFVFLTSITQVALGREIMNRKEILDLRREILEDILCFYNEKLNSTQDYTNKTLKIQKVPVKPMMSVPSMIAEDRTPMPKSFPMLEYITDVNIKANDLCGIAPNCTELRNTSSTESENSLTKFYFIHSYTKNCKEYVSVFTDLRHLDSDYGYDVTNVPPGSYLQFIPETKEVLVIPSKEQAYKRHIETDIRLVKQELNKIKIEKFEDMLPYIVIPLFILIFVIITAKVIVKIGKKTFKNSGKK